MSNTPKNNGHVPPKNPMTEDAVERITESEKRKHGGQVQPNAYLERITRAAEKNSKK